MALILRDPPLVFFHIPKTAGQWVRAVLRARGRTDEDGLYHNLPERPISAPHLFLARHPAAWLASVWGQRDREGWPPANELDTWGMICRHANPHRTADVEEFVSSMLTGPDVLALIYADLAPLDRWHIGRSEDPGRVLSMLVPDAPVNMPRVNTAPQNLTLSPSLIKHAEKAWPHSFEVWRSCGP